MKFSFVLEIKNYSLPGRGLVSLALLFWHLAAIGKGKDSTNPTMIGWTEEANEASRSRRTATVGLSGDAMMALKVCL